MRTPDIRMHGIPDCSLHSRGPRRNLRLGLLRSRVCGRRNERAAEVVDAERVLPRAERDAHDEKDALHNTCDSVRDPR